MALQSLVEEARSQLQDRLRIGVEDQCRPVTLLNGQVPFEANAPSDGLYMFEPGELRIYSATHRVT